VRTGGRSDVPRLPPSARTRSRAGTLRARPAHAPVGRTTRRSRVVLRLPSPGAGQTGGALAPSSAAAFGPFGASRCSPLLSRRLRGALPTAVCGRATATLSRLNSAGCRRPTCAGPGRFAHRPPCRRTAVDLYSPPRRCVFPRRRPAARRGPPRRLRRPLGRVHCTLPVRERPADSNRRRDDAAYTSVRHGRARRAWCFRAVSCLALQPVGPTRRPRGCRTSWVALVVTAALPHRGWQRLLTPALALGARRAVLFDGFERTSSRRAGAHRLHARLPAVPTAGLRCSSTRRGGTAAAALRPPSSRGAPCPPTLARRRGAAGPCTSRGY
jgi:hypothetical protein